MHHKLAHGAGVLINEGDEKFPNLRRLAVEEHKAHSHVNRAATLQRTPIPASARFAAPLARTRKGTFRCFDREPDQ